MPPTTLALVLSLVEEAIRLEPAIRAEIESLLAKDNPTPEDWQALRIKVLSKSYRDYVPATALPPDPAPL